MSIELNKGQLQLKQELKIWYKHRTKPYYYYSGKAGTGKTTVVRAFLEDMRLEDGEYITCAYVGKAVMVLSQKGYNACTIHSLIYDTIVEVLRDTYTRDDGTEVQYRKTIMHFELKKSLSSVLKLIIVDECMMVNDKMITELLSFGIPIIFMGDENQLPPVMGSCKILEKPDFVLNEIMRQAEDDPIVQIANRILEGKNLEPGVYGKSRILDSHPFDKTLLTNYDIILCGKNKTRDQINNRIRSEILHLNQNRIYVGEKLICRQNNWDEHIGDIYLTNGMTGFVENINYEHMTSRYVSIDFCPDFLDEGFEDIKLDRKYFYLPQEQKNEYGISSYNKFEYGYAITVHLAQGSEYDDVLLIAEYVHDPRTTRRLWYTGVTRAVKSITIVRTK